MLDRFFDLRRLVGCGEGKAQPSGGDYLCRLGQSHTNLGQKFVVINPEALDISPLPDEVTLRQVNGRTTQPRIADEVSTRRLCELRLSMTR